MSNESKTTDLWDKYNWTRVKDLAPSTGIAQYQTPLDPTIKIKGRNEIIKLLKRRSASSFSNEFQDFQPYNRVLTLLQKQREKYPWLSFRVLSNNLTSLNDGLYSLNADGFQYKSSSVTTTTVAPIIQNQWWINGSGLSIFVVVDFHTAFDAFRFEDGYHYLYLTIGQIGQEITEQIVFANLKARMTPAISESLAKSILQVSDQGTEIVYYFRCGQGT